MSRKKLVITILIIIVLSMLPFLSKTYKENKATRHLKQQAEEEKDTFNKSLRFNLKLEDKKYYYKNINSNITGYINGKEQNLKWSSYVISGDSEYVITRINGEEADLYCDIHIDKASKDYIKTFSVNNSTIYVTPFNDNKVIFLDTVWQGESEHAYILDLAKKSITWTLSNKLAGAYYGVSTNTVICTRNIQPSDDIMGKMEYEYFEVTMYGEALPVTK